MSLPSEGETETAQISAQVGTWFRILVPCFGFLLMGVGAYWVWMIGSFCLAAAQDPKHLEAPIQAMESVLSLEGAEWKGEAGKVALSRLLAGLFLGIWYGLTGWIAVTLLAAGGRLALGVTNERREFLAAMREYLGALREQAGKEK